MQHVRVGEHEVGAPAQVGALLARRVAVVDRRPRPLDARARAASAPGPAPAPSTGTGTARAPRASRESTSSVGSWKHSDLPDAVPVVTIVVRLERGLERLGLVAPERVDAAPRAAPPATSGCSSSGSSTSSGKRACCIAWRTSRSSSRPAWSSASHGSMSRTIATRLDPRRRGELPITGGLMRRAPSLRATGRDASSCPSFRPAPPTPPMSATRPRPRGRAATPSAATRSTRTRPPASSAAPATRCASATARARAL